MLYDFSVYNYNDDGVFDDILMYGMQKTLTMTMTCFIIYCCYTFQKKHYITNKENDNDMFDEMLLYVIQLKLKMVMKMTMFDEILLYVTQQTGQTAHSLSL